MRKFNSAEGLNFSIKRLIGVVCLLLCPVVHGLNVDGQSIVSKAKSRIESYNIEMNMAPVNMSLESFVYWAYTYCEDFRRCIDEDIPEGGYKYAQRLLDSCLNARDVVMRLCLRAQDFRNHIHLVLSDLLANAEYDLKAKSPGDSNGISLDELKIIQEQIRTISVLSANNADLLQFMEEGGLDKLEASLKEELQVIPQASKFLIIEIINAYKSKTERYPLDLLKNGKLKVYLGVATSVSADAPAKPTLVSAEVQADAPAKPTLEVSSPVELASVAPSVRPKMQLKLSTKSTAYGVPETPPVDTARADRFRAAIGNVFGTVWKNTSIVTDRNSLDPKAIIITADDYALIKDSVISALAEVSSGSADDFMKKGTRQFEAIQMLDQHLKKIQASITKKQNARKQLNLQRLSPSKGASNRGNPQQLTALDREIESLNGKIKALQAISARVKDIFHDFQTGKQSPSSIEIPQFVLVLDDQNSTTESAPPTEGQPAAQHHRQKDSQRLGHFPLIIDGNL